MTAPATTRDFTVLAIDAGGVRGIIPGIVLRTLEQLAQERGLSHVAQLFDLMVGTSTGGNMVLGLACPGDTPSGYRYDAAGVLAVYQDPANSRRIFTPYLPFLPSTGGPPLSPLWGLLTPRYSARGIAEEMQRQFGTARLREVRTPVSCVAYDIAAGAPMVFRSTDGPADTPDHRLCDLACAISAAPLYFPPVPLPTSTAAGSGRFVDGGVCLPDPAILAFVEACNMLEARHGDLGGCNIHVLSIGTGANRVTYDPGWAGLWGWMRRGHLLDLLTESGTQVVDLEDRLLTQPRGRVDIRRIQVPLVGATYRCAPEMDDWTATNLDALAAAGAFAAATYHDDLVHIADVGAARRGAG